MTERHKEKLDSLAVSLLLSLSKKYQKKTAIGAEEAGVRLGKIAYIVDKKHRLRTASNLNIAFPDWDEARVKAATKSIYEHFGRIMGDFLRSPARSNEEVLAAATVEGYEHLEQAKNMGRGILAITGHLGNWERFPHWMVASGTNCTVVARDANQKGIQAEVLKLREATGSQVLSRGSAAREIITRLRKNEMIGLMPDQNDSEVFVPFFGKMCGTVLGPAVLHLRTKAPILPAFCVRTGPARYHIKALPLIIAEEEETPESITSRVNLALESVIREYPEQYLWLHDRWKSARQKGLL